MVHRSLKADRYSHAPTSGLGRSKWALHPQGVVKVVDLGLPHPPPPPGENLGLGFHPITDLETSV